MPYCNGRSSLLSFGNLSLGTMSSASHSGSFSVSNRSISSPLWSDGRGAR